MSNSTNIVKLRSSDGNVFEIGEDAARSSELLKDIMEDNGNTEIPIPEVKSTVLSKVIEYCSMHANTADGIDLKAWDSDFAKVDRDVQFDLIIAANYLNIKSLLELMCENIANIIEKKKVEEIREFFDIENDFTPEEEQSIRNENPWAFD